MSGTIYLIVGPSGVGKDTLIDGARRALPDYLFVQRYITRETDSGGEEHAEISLLEFERMVEEKKFCVWWRAHDLGYGIHSDVARQVYEGATAVINTSRGSVSDFEAAFDHVITVHITASDDNLRQRLLSRGRESGAQIDDRLRRRTPPVEARQLVEISNDGAPEIAIRELIKALETHKQVIGTTESQAVPTKTP